MFSGLVIKGLAPVNSYLTVDVCLLCVQPQVQKSSSLPPVSLLNKMSNFTKKTPFADSQKKKEEAPLGASVCSYSRQLKLPRPSVERDAHRPTALLHCITLQQCSQGAEAVCTSHTETDPARQLRLSPHGLNTLLGSKNNLACNSYSRTTLMSSILIHYQGHGE